MPERWTVLYDDDCGLCRWLLALLLHRDHAARLHPLALQRKEAAAMLTDLTPGERMGSWHLISPGGERTSAGAAVAPLLALLPFGGPAAGAAARFPALTERAYAWVAEHRSQLGRTIPPGAKRRAARYVHARELGD